MNEPTCPTCAGNLTVKLPARQIESGTVGAAGGKIPIGFAGASVECSNGHRFTQYGSRLVAVA